MSGTGTFGGEIPQESLPSTKYLICQGGSDDASYYRQE